MGDDVLVRVENVSKRFCRSLKRSLWYGLQDLGSELGGRRHGGGRGLPQSSADVQLRPDEFWAVKDVSFELRRGECLGLIGRNGAGKTTLLRMLNGLIKPDTGRIEMKGNVGALIALGAGFSPILTGRENIYTNGSILGLSTSQISKRVDEIIYFADLHESIDSSVQTYSSGMQARLGFAIATSFCADIVILDEVLAVGDASFRARCYERIGAIREQSSIIFVSHHMEQIGRICNKAATIHEGSIIHYGNQEKGIEVYNQYCTNNEPSTLGFASNSDKISYFNVDLHKKEVSWAENLELTIGIATKTKIALGRVVFYDSSEQWCCDSIIRLEALDINLNRRLKIKTSIGPLYFKKGGYKVTIHLIDEQGTICAWSHMQNEIRIKDSGILDHACYKAASKIVEAHYE